MSRMFGYRTSGTRLSRSLDFARDDGFRAVYSCFNIAAVDGGRIAMRPYPCGGASLEVTRIPTIHTTPNV